MKNKGLVIAIVIGLIVLLGIGAYFIFGKKTASTTVGQTPVEEETILTMTPEEVGLSIEAGTGNKKVIFEVSKTEGIASLDYELSYISKGDIPRGAMGHIEVDEGETVTQEVTLGTCSDVCHYDEDVSDVKLVLRVTKTDGSTAQVEKSLALE
jgi:hypothetical protein